MQEGYENKIVDLTMEPFQYEFPAKEMIEGHKFVHMCKGIFRADPVFQISKKELISLIRIYRDLIFYGFWKENEFEIRFAISNEACILDQDFLWTDDEFSSCDEVISLGQNRLSEIKWYGFETRHFLYSTYEEYQEYEESENREDFIISLPTKKEALKLIYRSYKREDGLVPRILVHGCIGDMVEPGIYYFHEKQPELFKIKEFEHMAAVVYDVGYKECELIVGYLAVEEKYFERIKEITEIEKGYYYENGKKREENWGTEEFLREGEELLAGVGTKDIELYFEIPLEEKQKFYTYAYAARIGHFLVVLEEEDKTKIFKTRTAGLKWYDMRLMTKLFIKKDVELRCGYTYRATVKIIDCREEKYKEILKPEIYKLYMKQWEKKNCLKEYLGK